MPELELLDAYLRSDAAHPKSMGISDLDGFLTGLACCPEPIPVLEWLEAALGDLDETPVNILDAVKTMHHGIRDLLEQGHPIEPVFWESQDAAAEGIPTIVSQYSRPT